MRYRWPWNSHHRQSCLEGGGGGRARPGSGRLGRPLLSCTPPPPHSEAPAGVCSSDYLLASPRRAASLQPLCDPRQSPLLPCLWSLEPNCHLFPRSRHRGFLFPSKHLQLLPVLAQRDHSQNSNATLYLRLVCLCTSSARRCLSFGLFLFLIKF